MLRRIIEIDEEKCNGCGLCAKACHEGAIGMVNGKAKLMHEHYCDGLGDCLPACPTGAIRFVEREAPAYDEAAVQAAKAAKGQAHTGGCPGSRMRTMQEKPEAPAAAGNVPSQLRQWPVQIKLVSPAAPYFDGADLLIAADCTAYAYGNFHSEFMRGKVTLIGCPKLDAVDYSEKLTQILRTHEIRSITVVQYAEKLTEIFARNDIRSVTLTRMEVPCCGGMEFAIRTALGQAGKEIPFRTVVLSIDGAILEER